MPSNRRDFVKKRQPPIPAYRQRQPPAAARDSDEGAGRVARTRENRRTKQGTADRLAKVKDEAQALRGRDDLVDKAVAANQKTREAQRALNELDPLHRASTGAQRTVLDRRIRRALARLNAALREFVVIEEAMSADDRAKLRAIIDELPPA